MMQLLCEAQSCQGEQIYSLNGRGNSQQLNNNSCSILCLNILKLIPGKSRQDYKYDIVIVFIIIIVSIV